MTAKETLCKFKLAKDMPSLACPYYYCAKIHDRMSEQHRSKLAQTGLCAPYCLPSFKKTIHSRNKMVYKQIGTRNKMVLNHQFGNNVFHARIGTRNKTLLNYQFGNNVFHEQANRNWEQDGPKSSIWEQCVPCTDGNSEQNSPKLSIWQQCVPFTDRNTEQNSRKLSIWEQRVPCTDRNSEQNAPKLSIWEQCVP